MTPLRSAWDAVADQWIAWARKPGHDSYWRFHRDAFLGLVPKPGDLTVDIGCGEGRVSRDLTALGHRVVSLDGSVAMARAARLEAGTTPTVVADAAALPLRAGAADVAIAFMSFQDVDDMESAIAEAARLLHSGGRLCMAIVHPVNSAGKFVGEHGDPTKPFVITGSWFERRRYADELVRDGLPMRFESEHRALQDYVDALADAGFLIERMKEVTEPDPGDVWYRMPLFLDIVAVRA